MDRGTRAALIMGVVPVVVGLLYLGLQVTAGDPIAWVQALIDGGEPMLTGTADPAGVTMLIAFGIALAFGFSVILRGARDL